MCEGCYVVVGCSTYDEVYAYAMGRPGLLQHVADAHAAQTADAGTKPITLFFALAGLHLRVDRGFSGRTIQRVHMVMGRDRRDWPGVQPPADRGSITAADVHGRTEERERDQMIESWCRSVWAAYASSHAVVAEATERYL